MTRGQLLFAGDRLRVHGANLDSDRFCVSFDHWQADRDDFGAFTPSQTVIAKGYGQISLRTRCNDWFLNPETEIVRRKLTRLCRGKTSTAIGFSMGGYGALLFARALRLHRVLLVSPQSSIFPQTVPFESRYQKEAAPLDPTLDVLDPPRFHGLEGLALFDPLAHPADRQHVRRICGLFPGIAAVAMPFGGHPAIHNYRGTGIWPQLFTHHLDATDTAATVAALRRALRGQAKGYQTALRAALDRRAARDRPKARLFGLGARRAARR